MFHPPVTLRSAHSLDGALAHWTADGGGVISIHRGSITTGEESFSALYAGGAGSTIRLEQVAVRGGGLHGCMAQFGGKIIFEGECVVEGTWEHAYYEAEGEQGDGDEASAVAAGSIEGVDRELLHIGPAT